ncbi:hypothetical protein VTI28DRAFT_7469 [Corynascus sepedonium]
MKQGIEGEKAQEPAVHIGPVGSGDTVIKSGEHRDHIARAKGIIAFEMEGADVAVEIPYVVIKGVYDYADCHKNKKWQNFTAATAASVLKAVLERYMLVAESRERLVEAASRQPCFLVPFGRNKDFVGRESTLARLLERIPPSADRDDCQRTAIEGLGGVGKTQIALEAAFQVRDEHPDCHIARVDDKKADVKLLVKTTLSQSADDWLLIVDNADDVELLFSAAGAIPLYDYLPFSYRGFIPFTTRNHEAIVKLDIPQRGIVNLAEMSRPEAADLLQRNVEYLNYCQSGNERLIELLSKDFKDRTRYKSTRNPVATTWLISFRHISRDNLLAAQYLRFMSFLAEKEIPKSLLPPGKSDLEADEAIGTLKAYAFITERPGQESYDMHRLVQLAMRNWLAKEGELTACATTLIQHLDKVFPFPKHENRAIWARHLPHALTILGFQDHSTDNTAKSSLLFKVVESNSMLGKYQDVEALYRQTLKLQTQVLGTENPGTLYSMLGVANTLYSQGKYEEAKALCRQTLKLKTQVLGADHPDTLNNMNSLANTLHNQGEYEEAEALCRHTLKSYGCKCLALSIPTRSKA